MPTPNPEPPESDPCYTVKQRLDGDRLFVWVQETVTLSSHVGHGEDFTFTGRYHQRATSKPHRYCKIIASAERYAKKRNERRRGLQKAMERGC